MKKYLCDYADENCPICQHGEPHEDLGCADNQEHCETRDLEVVCVEVY